MRAEEARELLRELADDQADAKLERRIAKLPRGDREIATELARGTALLSHTRRSSPASTSDALAALSSQRRLDLFGALLPRMADALEALYEASADSPYLDGFMRYPFRAPRSPRVYSEAAVTRISELVGALRVFDPDLEWAARWAGHLHRQRLMGMLLAAAIRANVRGASRARDLLDASFHGSDEVATFGQHVVIASLQSDEQEWWERIENALLAAQREEGLRQSVLEAADFARPAAFRRLLEVISRERLGRFSATVRAVGTWVGADLDVSFRVDVENIVAQLAELVDDDQAQAEAISDGDAKRLYLGLWSAGQIDVDDAIGSAAPLLDDDDPGRRGAAATFLCQTRLRSALESASGALTDSDLRVAAIPVQSLAHYGGDLAERAVSDRLHDLLRRVPSQSNLKPLVWPWDSRTLKRTEVARVWISQHPTGSRLDPIVRELNLLDADNRSQVMRRLSESSGLSRTEEQFLFESLGDRSERVRGPALELAAAGKMKLNEARARELEALLTRKAGDLRRGVIDLLAARGERAAITSAESLLEGDTQQRLAGLELLRLLNERGRGSDASRKLADCFRDRRGAELLDEERLQVDAILGRQAQELVAQDWTLGLFVETDLTEPRKPKASRRLKLGTKSSAALLLALDALVHEHRDDEFDYEWWGGRDRGTVATIPQAFAAELRSTEVAAGLESADHAQTSSGEFPLLDVWTDWWSRAASEFSRTDLLVVAASPSLGRFADERSHATYWKRAGRIPDRYLEVVKPIAAALLLREADAESVASGVRLAEAQMARAPWSDLGSGPAEDWTGALDLCLRIARTHPDLVDADDHRRLIGLLLWRALPADQRARLTPAARAHEERSGGLLLRRRHFVLDVRDLSAALRAGAASEADLLALLLKPPSEGKWSRGHPELSWLERPGIVPDDHPAAALVGRIRKRVLETEPLRGEHPTPASGPALAISRFGGLTTLRVLLPPMARHKFVRGWVTDSLGKEAILSHMIRATRPTRDETPESFAADPVMNETPQARLIELAAYAPQWARHVETMLGWKGLAASVWWLHAHTKDDQWRVPAETRELWEAEVSERTPLSGTDLVDGAVDVTWFRAAFEELGEKRWKSVEKAAKLAASGGGHKRATTFAQALRGDLNERELRERIEAKRHQDSVRALGLLPLARGGSKDPKVLERYEALQEFKRGSKKFGSQRQASEGRAVDIAMENLARTAGFDDPLRLTWAMESEALADMASGDLVVKRDDYEIRLAIDSAGRPELTSMRDERKLKNVPAKLRKDEAVSELRERATALRRQSSRTRTSLEQAMVRGDAFSGSELVELGRHALLRPMMHSLLLVCGEAVGRLDAGGEAIVDPGGRQSPVAAEDQIRLAHPLDLLESGSWSDWQRYLIEERVTQPFKQAFRELYLPTADEREEAKFSRRYAGHQLQPRKALGVLGSRGWLAHPELGLRRMFHRDDVLVTLGFLYGPLTPAEVEAPTVEVVEFRSLADETPINIEDVPPLVFSEAMRDVDLVVSVAHASGVDPEASGSTIEMRASLVTETVDLLGFENVTVQERNVLIDGEIGDYSVNLGSGSVHRRPGGAVCIVPIHSSHRGRVFLPFADDDPKTAEVVAKVMLLARDGEIKDPTILQQLRPG